MFAIWIDKLSTLGSQEFENQRWRWCRLGPGSRNEGEGDLAEIARELESRPDAVTLLIAARECLDLWLKVPPMNTRRLRQAVPFIAEEQVAQPIEAMHFAVGERRAQHIRCIATSRTLLQTLLDTLARHRVLPVSMYLDAALVRVKGRQLCILKDGERALVRTPELATEVPCERLPILIDSLLQSSPESSTEPLIEVIADDDGKLAESIKRPGVRVLARRSAGTCLAELLPGSEVSEVNLLVEEFEPRASMPQNRRWKLPIALAASLLALVIVSDLLVGYLAKLRVATLIDESIEVYRRDRPSIDGDEGDLVRLIHREQGTSSQETRELLEMLNRVSGTFSTHGASVRSLSYQSGSGAVDVEVLVEGYDTLDALERDATGKFQEVSMLGATQTQEGVRARLRLGGVGR